VSRPIDLARLAGISTQQVRNLAAAGVLPPTARTAADYRRFDERHRRALLTYQALVLGYGIHLSRSMMRAIHDGDVPAALALVDEGHADLHAQRLALAAVTEALESVAGQEPDTSVPARSSMSIGDVAAAVGVRTSALRVWESAELLMPRRDPITGYRRYGPADVRDARMIMLLRQGHYPLPQIRPILEGLRRTGSSDALRAATARRRADLTERTMAMLEGSGLLHDYLEGQ
jgi:DNA-binding transcriptional MerR regulator